MVLEESASMKRKGCLPSQHPTLLELKLLMRKDLNDNLVNLLLFQPDINTFDQLIDCH